MHSQRKTSDGDIRQLYRTIYSWHQTNKHKSQLPPQRQKKYLKLVHDLPEPEEASVADISFVCKEVDDGLMAWSCDEKIDHEGRIADLVEKIIEELGGHLQAHSVAAKSKLARKHWPKMKLLENLLQLLSAEELRQLYVQYHKEPTISKTAAKSFVLRKVIEEVPLTCLFGDSKVSSLLSVEFEELSAFFRNRLLDLDRSDLDKICQDFGKSELSKKYKSKSKLIDRLLQDIPVHMILGSNVLQRKLRKKAEPIREIRKIESAINDLIRTLQKMTQKESEHLSHVEDTYERLQESLRHQEEELKAFLGMKASPDAMKFLEIFRKELVSLGEPLSAKKLCESIERVRSQLQTDELSFTLKGLEILLAHYLWNKVKDMQWPPDFQEFIHIIREEIPKIQILPNQAEIPALRERVTQRLGISDSVFDSQLTQAWKKGFIKLDVGAPLGRNNVKYLKHKQSEYFYVKLLR